jgi:hypothetical protein
MLKTAVLECMGFGVVQVEYKVWDDLMMQDASQRSEWLLARIREAAPARDRGQGE